MSRRKHINLRRAVFIVMLLGVIWLPNERRMTVFLTGYSYWDNTPPASAIIGRPIIHDIAAGIGTYNDPVTLAVGWRRDGSKISEDFKPGTRFYIPRLRKYAVVEDLCGDGEKPQAGPCHVGWEGHPWLDVYVDGSARNADEADRCMEKLTGIQPVLTNPRRGYRVSPGPIVEAGCKTF
ncbi:hypothetical protein [Sulfitobacter sp. W074]|uniref:hypothetical protein n=1 Tax=Sulfitobacter sp. W074 TaxID=2867026 RepID=UPI0021A4563B|nr:hypothetical protein [Sulfitobacter sp. W074]